MAGIVMAADLAESGELSSKMPKQLLDISRRRKRFPVVYEREADLRYGRDEAMIAR
jgi:aspartyl-tRNA(Asn)/glutamyl-tRNA(Gln) amidotransferase subunit B